MSQLMIKASLGHSRQELDALSDQLKRKYPDVKSVKFWFNLNETTTISPDWLRKTVKA